MKRSRSGDAAGARIMNEIAAAQTAPILAAIPDAQNPPWSTEVHAALQTAFMRGVEWARESLAPKS